ncbi:hypothetical protein [Lyngbya confervoides]|uniref:Uncharacterized protein n=1 Tax=Lyngbya confervoides BDU141951 TaxID=1574623 RepID=A0ABD4T9J1_9CYAN|nr:hypothetical protein [Lyngbya confervoides]MCM1985125.1 hypothetical protein [Lyngbya confervoides BDU141951]
MQHKSNRLVYSPHDLIQFVNSEFACWMDRFSLENLDTAPKKEAPDEMLQSLLQLGREHEQNFLQSLLEQGTDVCRIDHRGGFSATQAAMQAGRAWIYQAALEAGDFLGYADFLVRVDEPSNLGEWSYIPLECKLALQPNPDFVLQSCCYVDLLEYIQGKRPSEFRLLLGDRTQTSFPTEQYIYYFYQVRQDFLAMMANFDPDQRPIPVVGNHGCWQAIADQILHQSDPMRGGRDLLVCSRF